MSEDMTKLLIEHDKALLKLSWTILVLNYAIKGIKIPYIVPKSQENKRTKHEETNDGRE